MISFLDLEIIVIGGGLSRIGEPLYARLRERTPRRTLNRFAARTPIVPAVWASTRACSARPRWCWRIPYRGDHARSRSTRAHTCASVTGPAAFFASAESAG